MTLGGHRGNIFPHCAGRWSRHEGRHAQSRATSTDRLASFVLVVWPTGPSVTYANPTALANIAAAMVRLMAEAQARLATLK